MRLIDNWGTRLVAGREICCTARIVAIVCSGPVPAEYSSPHHFETEHKESYHPLSISSQHHHRLIQFSIPYCFPYTIDKQSHIAYLQHQLPVSSARCLPVSRRSLVSPCVFCHLHHLTNVHLPRHLHSNKITTRRPATVQPRSNEYRTTPHRDAPFSRAHPQTPAAHQLPPGRPSEGGNAAAPPSRTPRCLNSHSR